MSAFEISRTAVVEADPARVHDLVTDFRTWPQWSPWEDSDPRLERTYEGPERGPGATCTWRGGRRAGSGTMTITGATAERVDITVAFERPFRATHDVVLELEPTASGATIVTWTLRGRRQGVSGLVARVVPVDRFLGHDLERGLERLDAAARA